VLLSLALVFGATGAAPNDAGNWIAQHCRKADGALTVRPDGSFVSGYFGNVTAAGLVASGSHLDVVNDWMEWYIDRAHGSGSGVDGVPDDGTYERDGAFVSRNRPDSTDAYGATFLILADAAYRTGDARLRALIVRHRADIGRIAASMLATWQPNGLTFSRPQHRIVYAIDNEQVYRGLLDAADLWERAYADASQAAALRSDAQRVENGIAAVLWSSASQTYRPSVNPEGRGAEADLTRPYPDALAQVMAIVYGIVPADSLLASTLLARASASLLTPVSGDADEYRQVVGLAREMVSRTPGDTTAFEPSEICSDAGWYLLAHPLSGGAAAR
jgi:hypothetical protein